MITIMFTVLTVGPTFPGDEYNFFGVATAWKRLSSREKISWIKIKENFRVESFDFGSKKYFWWSNMHERIFWQDMRATSRKITIESTCGLVLKSILLVLNGRVFLIDGEKGELGVEYFSFRPFMLACMMLIFQNDYVRIDDFEGWNWYTHKKKLPLLERVI